MLNEKEKYLKVARNTPVQALATSIVSAYREDTERLLILRSVGAVPLNQAIKAIIVANKELVKGGRIAKILPSFTTIPLAMKSGDTPQDNTAIELKLDFVRL